MTNWKKFKIVSIPTSKEEIVAFNLIVFSLDKHFDYSKPTDIFCANCYPFNTCKVGDYLEIDLDKIGNYKNAHEFDDTSVVRKFGSSAVVPSSSSSNQQLTTNQIQERDERMRRWVEESGGAYEVDFIARQEYRDDGKISAHEMKWTYRKK